MKHVPGLILESPPLIIHGPLCGEAIASCQVQVLHALLEEGLAFAHKDHKRPQM